MDAVKTGRLIVQIRKEKEMTQKDLGERLHVSVQAVSKWERGLSHPLARPLSPAGAAGRCCPSATHSPGTLPASAATKQPEQTAISTF